jgi:hypothetical protein
MLNAIHSYSDHPSLKYDKPTVLYLLDDRFYFADRALHSVILYGLRYTNMGEPFRQLARLEFKIQSTGRKESIDIELGDAARLTIYCQNNGHSLVVESQLASLRSFQSAIEDIEKDEC